MILLRAYRTPPVTNLGLVRQLDLQDARDKMGLVRLARYCTKPSFRFMSGFSPLRPATGEFPRAHSKSAWGLTGVRPASTILGSRWMQTFQQQKVASACTRKAQFPTSVSFQGQLPYSQYRLAQYPSDYTPSFWRKFRLSVCWILKWSLIFIGYSVVLVRGIKECVRSNAQDLSKDAVQLRCLLIMKQQLRGSSKAKAFLGDISDPGMEERALSNVRLRIIQQSP